MLYRSEEMKYVLSVSDINRYIKEIFSKDLVLSNIWVQGEISNFKHHYSGHMYFTLKDGMGIIKCVMFKTYASSLKFNVKDGMKVLARGYVSLFERDGQYQLYVEGMEQDGIGNLHLAFEELKRKLFERGWFDDEHKKPIPFLPKRIGVVTSPTGAVIRDIINVLSRRNEKFNLLIYPVAVQGETAPPQIAKAIRKLNDENLVDVIIIARGGGSLEELWAFNDEGVCEAVFKSKIPIISAIGHETDFTVTDFVADRRAPTPSAAAEIVMPEKETLKNTISGYEIRLKHGILNWLKLRKNRLMRIQKSSVFTRPNILLDSSRMKIDFSIRGLIHQIERKIINEKTRFKICVSKMDAMSPLKVLHRGYGIIRKANKKEIIRSVTQVENGEEIDIQLSDGIIGCVVKTKIE